MSKEKDIYTEKGEGKSATESDRKIKCSICGKGHKTSVHATKNKALEAKKDEKGEKSKSEQYQEDLKRYHFNGGK